ncbi:MAG TPA: cytidine deaminase [Clostridiaceae bacterium]|jgi:dCMP deaminase|nr:cytidine deaminase [Clostridiaceae bacterium]HBF76901.1 cytidine deaminase [Clostridiaceae bacterium]HBG39379.1 cytidine deaminase [Clostridiaceae bacterium]HBN27440.1 cytidine deaminase [Clostridiaceae bacterium]HBX47782.1 cytidine deaminase [Clostridiaceae bacterium]
MRPNWDDYFMEIAEVIKKRSTCIRRQVGAVIVKDNRILTTGYNGVPPKMQHCTEAGCLREKLKVPSGQRHELCRALHAEQNAVIQAAKNGIAIDGSTIYITTQPCIICAKILIASGIKKIVYNGEYPDELSMEMIKESKIEFVKYEGTVNL